MSFSEQDKAFDAQEIRVTTEVVSSISVSAGLIAKTVFVCNDHNQQGAFEVWGSPLPDHSKEAQLGTTFNVAANTTGFESFETYFPYIRIKATYSTAPTTGDLTVFIEKVSA